MEIVTAHLEQWMRDYYFSTDIDIGSSGVENFSMSELRSLVGIDTAAIDKVVFNDSPSCGADGLRRPPDERLHTREQLGEGERLGQVVVTAGLQAANAVVHGPPRTEDQHGRGDPPLPQLIDERKAVALRQHDVDDGHVVRRLQRRAHAALAVGGMVNDEAGLAQAACDEIGNRGIVFDDEGPHRSVLLKPIL